MHTLFSQLPLLQDERLMIRCVRTSEAQHLLDLFDHPLSLQHAKQMVQRWNQALVDRREWITGIYRKEDEQLVGIVEVYEVHGNKCKIGYRIKPEYQKQHYGMDGVYLVMPYLIDCGMQTIQATCDEQNIASLRILEHNGFELISKGAKKRHYEYHPKHLEKDQQQTQHVIYLASGCFWGSEKAFKALNGVIHTTVGYANGHVENPTYEMVCRDTTGFRETVKVEYDPNQISLRKIIKAFFYCIDPTQKNRQGEDVGSQYQTGVYYTNEEDHQYIQQLFEEEKTKHSAFYVELEPLQCFYAAEEYHQNYLDKHPDGYCHITSIEMDKIEQLNQEA